MDAAGNLYVADSANHRIRRISPAGTITTVAGRERRRSPGMARRGGSEPGYAAGGGGFAGGLLTLADTRNQRVRQLDALPAPGPDIHTDCGSGVDGADSLSLERARDGGRTAVAR